MIPIITPVSIERPWLWFEVGATWNNGRAGNCRIYPLCAPEIELENLPSPLDRLQALSMGRAQDLKMLFEALIDQFGFGKISSFRASNITNRIPKYKDVEIKQIDLNERALYSGRFSGYTSEELMKVIDDQFFRPVAYQFGNLIYSDMEKYLHTGELVHFRQVDKRLDLPAGTAKKLLNTVAERYGLVPVMETDNLVRYQLDDNEHG